MTAKNPLTPDYIICVNSDVRHIALCGRSTFMLFTFESLEHATNAMAQESRLLLCPDCKKKSEARELGE